MRAALGLGKALLTFEKLGGASFVCTNRCLSRFLAQERIKLGRVSIVCTNTCYQMRDRTLHSRANRH